MEVEFQITKKDYIDFYKLYQKSIILKRSALLIIFSVFMIIAVFNEHSTWWMSILQLIGYLIVFAFLLYFLPLLIVFVRMKKLVANEKAYLSKRKFTITEEGLISESLNHTSLRNWASITEVNINEQFIYFKLADKKLLIVPKRAFVSEIEAINFLGQAQRHSKTINFNFNSNHKYIAKPNYKWGYLGLVPIVGAVNGLIMLASGISKYKDVKYVLIGLAGILFTVIVFVSTVYYNFGDKPGSTNIKAFFNNQDSHFTQMQLNSLVKEIEFYKVQHGSYPDSLQQLNIKNEIFVDIHDSMMGTKNNFTYNYHRMGNKYTLFSAGIDQIPNTKDDIYPSIDTAKTGLIIKGR